MGRDLSNLEMEILQRAASSRGEILLLRVAEEDLPWVKAGGTSYTEPLIRKAAIDALQSLCSKGFVRHHSRDLYVLTPMGDEMIATLELENSRMDWVTENE